MIAGPEVARIVDEFEQIAGLGSSKEHKDHHEQTDYQQAAFCQQVLSLVSAFQEMGSPFLDCTEELFALDTKIVCSSDAVQTVNSIQSVGFDQYSKFAKERLENCTTPVSKLISCCKLPLFKQSALKVKPVQGKLALVRNDCSLFSRLYISCQTRSGDLDMFSHMKTSSVNRL